MRRTATPIVAPDTNGPVSIRATRGAQPACCFRVRQRQAALGYLRRWRPLTLVAAETWWRPRVDFCGIRAQSRVRVRERRAAYVSAGDRPVAAACVGIAHIASGCLTIAIAVAIAYTGFFPIDNGADAFVSQLNLGRPGGTPLPFPDFLISGPVFLVASLVVALGIMALGAVEVRIGRRALRGAGYFAALSFGIAWCIVSLLLANYLGFLLAGAAAVSARWARGWFQEMDSAAVNRRWTTPHRLKDWAHPDAPAAQAPSAADPGEPGVPLD